MEALVCCVEAETCSAEAEDCSATAATSAMSPSARGGSALICCDGGGDLADAAGDVRRRRAPIASNASRVCSTVATPSAVRAAALGDDADDVLRLGLDLADQRGDLAGGALGLLGQLADLFGDDGEAAALLAGAGGLDGGVEREQVGLLGDAGDRVDDAADLLGLGGAGPRIAVPTWALERRRPRGSPRWRRGGGGRPPRRPRGPARRPRRWRSRSRRWRSAARAASCTASRVDSTIRTWRSAPWATSVTAEAISPTARPASSEVDAICCDAEATVPAPAATSPISTPLSCSRIAL